MQLCKVCSHPFLSDGPLDSQTQLPIVDEQLVDASGKTTDLERLLEALFERGYKVLVFSQLVTVLNTIKVCVPTLDALRLFMGGGSDRVGRSSSNAGHCAA
jgi:SNF2 family DNA or RNA helicase